MFWLVALTTAHPRVSGENDTLVMRAHPHKGSSPRERGKLEMSGYHREKSRLIPA